MLGVRVLSPLLAILGALAAVMALGGCDDASSPVWRGQQVVGRSACGSCHVIPGAPLADGMAGPSLAGLGQRAIIGGALPNTTANLALWLRDPQRFAPGGAMPATALSQADARDAAAYLETLRKAP
jgi:cytochrome c